MANKPTPEEECKKCHRRAVFCGYCRFCYEPSEEDKRRIK